LSKVCTSLRALSNRAAMLEKYLAATAKGQVLPDQRLLRQVAAVANALPAVDIYELDGVPRDPTAARGHSERHSKRRYI
jgi:hypothetical protein